MRISIMSRSRVNGVAVGAVIAAAAVAVPTSASANSAVDWELNAHTAIWDVAQQLPWYAGRSFAMVDGAVYDAVNAIDGTPYRPYLSAPPEKRTYSQDAAVASAAYNVLVALFPDQQSTLQSEYDGSLNAIPDGPPSTAASRSAPKPPTRCSPPARTTAPTRA
jgi:hypothetical protein